MTPFFTIAIPTKNRPELVVDSVRSMLAQTCDDFEVIVCDNSDPSEAEQTSSRIRAFGDERIRYVRTSGRLSMPDNWEQAIATARGEYVGVLTDRSVFRRDALSTVRAEIEQTGARCVSWFNDLYGRDEAGTAFKRRASTFRRHRIESRVVLDYFLNGEPKFSTKIVPKLMTGVWHRSVIEAIRASPAGRCCLPVAPDFTSGFLMLAHCDWVLMLDEPLYVSSGFGNGSAFRRRTELGDQFRRDLGMSWQEMVDRMPTEACFSHALVLNDLLRVRDLVPDRLGELTLNRPQYYVGCLADYVKVARHGRTERDDDVDILFAGLERESGEVQSRVQANKLYRKARDHRASLGEALPSRVIARVKTQVTAVPQPSFDSVFDALAWDEKNPRSPAEESFLDRLPMLDPDRKLATLPVDPSEPQSAESTSAVGEREESGLATRLRRLARRA